MGCDMTATSAILFVIAILASVLGVVSFFTKKDDRLIADATWKGEVNGKLDAILAVGQKVEKVERDMKDLSIKMGKVESKADSAHYRIDEHIEKHPK